jgi:hypothetical protein
MLWGSDEGRALIVATFDDGDCKCPKLARHPPSPGRIAAAVQIAGDAL